jgi:hypothetical protein
VTLGLFYFFFLSPRRFCFLTPGLLTGERVIGRGTAQRSPEGCGAAVFFFRYLVAITSKFPIEFDVWVRLCTHYGVAKVMTCTCQSTFSRRKRKNIFIFFERKSLSKGRIVKERIQISHSTQGSRRRKVLKEAWKHH